MQTYKEVVRLKEDDRIGNRAAAVKRKDYMFCPQHWHDYYEIEVLLGGNGSYVLNGEPHPICKGDAYFLTPVDFHEIVADTEAVDIVNISFGERRLSENTRALAYSGAFAKMRNFSDEALRHLVSATELLQAECQAGGPCSVQLLEYIISRFIRQGARAETSANRGQLAGVMNAIAYMQVHFREDITLQGLAKLAGYHPTYFSELFYRVTGNSFVAHLTDLRMNYAKALLAQGVSVTETCFVSGFGSLSQFFSVFKAKCGVSPGAYQKSSLKRQ